MGGLLYSMYKSANIDDNGQKRSVKDTLIHILTLSFLLDNDLNTPVDSESDFNDRNLDATPVNKLETSAALQTNNILEDDNKLADDNILTKLESNLTKYKKKPKKEVFNIDNSIFTYDQAPSVCKAFGAKLATPAQIENAYKNGANWCNAGWVEGQEIAHPIQKSYLNSLSKKEQKECGGRHGTLGRKFSSTIGLDGKQLRFGVNCYGKRPTPDESVISYNNKNKNTECNNKSSNKNQDEDTNTEDDQIGVIKKFIKNGKITPRPYSNTLWSEYSHKKSSYVLSDNTDSNNEIINSLMEFEPESEIENSNITNDVQADVEDVL